MTFKELLDIVNDLHFNDWVFSVKTEHDLMFLRVSFMTEDNWETDISKSIIQHRGRWWVISEHMTRSEVTQTALKAVLTAIEHEAREQFLYQGKAIYGPHLDPDALLEVADRVDVRDPIRP